MTTDPAFDRQRAREELAQTLDAIEAKLNVPKRVRRGVRQLQSEHPLALAAGAVGAAAVVGALAFLGVRRAR